MSSIILKQKVASLTDVFASLIGTSICKHSIPDCWRPVSIVTIPIFSNSTILAKCFRPNIIVACGPKQVEGAIMRRLPYTTSAPMTVLRLRIIQTGPP